MNTNRIRPGSVVVGVDGSADSDRALTWAVAYATDRRRPLVIIHGGGLPQTSPRIHGVIEARRALRMNARRVTDQALLQVKKLTPELDVEVHAPLTDAREALLGLADQAAMIVVGTRGRGPARSLALGSVSVAVACHAVCPVAVVRETGDPDGPIVVGLDSGPSSTNALEFAFDLAAVRGRRLKIVHAWSFDDAFLDLASVERLEEMQAHEHLLTEATRGFAEKWPDVEFERHTFDGGAVEELVRLSVHASSVIVGSRGRSGVRVVLASISRAVVERSHCTVLVVRP